MNIGTYAFAYCSGLTSINIPSSVTTIGTYAFYYCSGLSSIYVNSKPITLPSSYVFSSVNTSTCILNVPYNTKTLYAAATYWNVFTNIVEATFGFVLDVNKLNMPIDGGSSTVSITGNATWTASSDQSWLSVSPTSGSGNNTLSFTVQANQTSSPRRATVTVSASGINSQTITVIQARPPKTTNVTAGNLATVLTTDELNSINDLTLTGTIDARDFKTMRDNMPLLARLDLSTVNIMAYTGTAGTYSTSSTIYPANEIPADAFYNPSTYTGKISLISVVMPLSTNSIGNYAFQRCSTLTSITIPSAVTSIGTYAFANCSGLTSVTIPSAVTSIGTYAFANCSGLTSIIIPSSVTTIGSSAFYGCSGIINITIPSSVTTIGIRAMGYCTKLTAIFVESANLNYSGLDGVLFDKNQTSLIQYPAGKTDISYYIPASVTSIGDYAFQAPNSLTSVTIPSSVTSIGYASFAFCSGLTSITIPSSVTTIGSNAFSDCSGLTSINVETTNQYYSGINGVLFDKNQLILIQYPTAKTGSYTIPSSVTSIGGYAFYKCYGLTSFTIPSSVTTIGTYAFYYCSGLTSINIPSSVTSIGSSAFSYCSGLSSIYVNSKPIVLPSSSVFSGVNTSTCTLYVPYSTKTLYAAASYWSNFTNIVESTSGFILGSNTAKILNVAGSSTTVDISANVYWSASSDQSWLTVSPGSGSGNGILTLTSVSQSQTLRTATVTVSSSGYASQTIIVTETNGITYCTAGSTSASEYISNVAIASINQASGFGTSGYQDYTSQITTMQIGVNTSATITVTNPYASDQVIIWIDWNQDGVFDELSEKVYASTGTLFTSPHTSANFAPPAGAKIGLTRMRIRLHDTASGPNATSCGTSSYGEVEDYTVNVINATATPTVSDGGSFHIYPNPVKDAFKIDGFEGVSTIKISDLNGREIMHRNVTKNESVSIDNLQKGLYILKIISDAGIIEKKIIKE